MPENGVMKGISAGRSGWPHLAWAMWLPCVFAVVVGGLFAVVDLAGMVMGSWDTPVAGLGWLKAGAIGQSGLALVAAAVLIAGAARRSWHRDYGICDHHARDRLVLAGPHAGSRPSVSPAPGQ